MSSAVVPHHPTWNIGRRSLGQLDVGLRGGGGGSRTV